MGKHQNNNQPAPVLEPDEIMSPVQIERLEVVFLTMVLVDVMLTWVR